MVWAKEGMHILAQRMQMVMLISLVSGWVGEVLELMVEFMAGDGERDLE
jgi:hypothetical protein